MTNSAEPLILAIETATRAGSVALSRGTEVLSSAAGNAAESHSISLLEAVEDISRQVNVKLSDIDLFAAASGPGSFTGLRIGLATTKAFAVCTGRKCVGVSTLAAIAHAAGHSEHTIALLPAGRGELFAQLFAVSSVDVQPLDGPAHLAPAVVTAKYSELKRVILAGEGAHLYSEGLGLSANDSESRAGSESRQAESSLPSLSETQRAWTLAPRCDQLASSIAALALNDYRRGNVLDADELRAVYVRPSDAEINERWQQQKSQPSVQP
jgi:tRNA threonylcarbamoyladenosine biosynthesis protein TsaB